jgi:multidrug efflux system outer membrane protein
MCSAHTRTVMNQTLYKILSRLSAILTILLFLQSCTMVGPNYEAPALRTPDAWTEKISLQVNKGPQAALQTWWMVFDDPKLDDLIERSRKENIDLKIAVSRIRESRAILAIANGRKLPQVDASGEASRTEPSDNGILAPIEPLGGVSSHSLFQLGVDASWEIDVFGRVRRTIEAAGATYQASIEDYRDVLVTLFAEVALSYIDIRTAQQQIVYTKANAEDQQAAMALAQDRYDNGLSSKLDVVQAKANLAMTQSMIPQLQISLNLALNRLAVLLGQDAGSLQTELFKTHSIPKPEKAVGIGVPADVLRQRPDIRRAERLLASQTAKIGVATAALYPRFSLSGSFGLQSRSLDTLFNSSSATWFLGAPMQWNLFSGGQVQSNIQVQQEKTQQLLLSYENMVLSAIEEVENAIAGYDLNLVRIQHLQEAVSASTEAVDLVLVQYNTGLTDFNNVLVSQRDLLSQQDQYLISESQAVVNLISLYKALGGGWDLNEKIDSPSTP